MRYSSGADVAVVATDVERARPRVCAGKSHVYAPELLEIADRSPTLASDVYAYGLLLWCLFSGRPHVWADVHGHPPSAAQWTELVTRIVSLRHRPDLGALRPDTPAAVMDIMQRCWAQVCSLNGRRNSR